MKKLIFFIILGFCSNIYSQEVIPIDEGLNEICQDILDVLNLDTDQNAVVCLIKENQDQAPFLYTVTLAAVEQGCNILSLEGNQELTIPNRTQIRLLNGFQIKLSDNATIKGDHFGTSQIVMGEHDVDHTAIDMNDCDGCSVSGITIISEANTENNVSTGLNIGIGGNNELNEVKFQGLDNGIIVNGGSGNVFNDLQFVSVGADLSDCDAANNTTAAIELINSINNNISNIFHNASPGAVTVKLTGHCDFNTILNISVEQEDSHCINGGDDPALYIDNSLLPDNIFGNIITCNFNHAKTTVQNVNANIHICVNNKISNLDNCNVADLQIDCGTN